MDHNNPSVVDLTLDDDESYDGSAIISQNELPNPPEPASITYVLAAVELRPNSILPEVIDLTMEEEPRPVPPAILIEQPTVLLANDIPKPSIIKLSQNVENNFSRVEIIWTCNKGRSQQRMIRKYEIYFRDSSQIVPPNEFEMWDLIGEVEAMSLPMSCKICMGFIKNHTYSFMMRAKDFGDRYGTLSEIKSIIIE